MGNVAVVGSQWGDEGKGKIVDWLSSRADVVVRFQGGHNAGHTLVVDGVQYKLSLLPSGVVRGGKLSVIGNGVVVDPWALLDEIDTMAGKGVDVSPETLTISENVCLILPIHRELDQAREEARGGARLGTTGRGIGPAYEDKVGRRAIRLCDLRDVETLRPRLGELLLHHDALRRGFGIPDADAPNSRKTCWKSRPACCPSRRRSGTGSTAPGRRASASSSRARRGRCWTSTTAPIPSSPRPTPWPARRPPAPAWGPETIGYVLGITKAYTTRVGGGPFPTELDDEVGRTLGERGREFGTVTGRPRRCGWFDSVLVRQAVKIGGIRGIALTKLDVLDGMPALKVCVGYRRNGEVLDHIPAATADQAQVRPVYETFDGWQESTRGARSWADLPATAVKYIRRIEELIEAPVAMLSTSPEREDTILVHDPFAD